MPHMQDLVNETHEDARRRALEDAIAAVSDEAVEIDPDNRDPTDVSYNRALEHAIEAIRALLN